RRWGRASPCAPRAAGCPQESAEPPRRGATPLAPLVDDRSSRHCLTCLWTLQCNGSADRKEGVNYGHGWSANAALDSMPTGPISRFVDRQFLHFNAAALKDAADAYIRHLENGGTMLLTVAGAMSTAELGISMAEMIRAKKVHAICCTGANLEED